MFYLVLQQQQLVYLQIFRVSQQRIIPQTLNAYSYRLKPYYKN